MSNISCIRAWSLFIALPILGFCLTNVVWADAIVNPRSDDLWDISQGSVVTGHSGMAGGFSANEFISESLGTWPIFRDDRHENFVHFFEWQTSSDIDLKSFSMIAAHDLGGGRDARYRGFKTFRLFGFNDSTSTFDQLFELTDIPLLYKDTDPLPGMLMDYRYGDNGLAFWANIPTFTGDRFRAEFVQYSSAGFGHASGPRIRELDGFDFAAVPEPGSFFVLMVAFAAGCLGINWRARESGTNPG